MTWQERYERSVAEEEAAKWRRRPGPKAFSRGWWIYVVSASLGFGPASYVRWLADDDVAPWPAIAYTTVGMLAVIVVITAIATWVTNRFRR